MTEVELAAIEARATAATAGPWMWRERLANTQGGRTKRRSVREGRLVYLLTRALYPHEHLCDVGREPFSFEDQLTAWCDDPRCVFEYESVAVMRLPWATIRRDERVLYNVGPPLNDAAFIAHARTDVPALIAEVRRLRVALARIRDSGVVPTESRTGVICRVCRALGTVDRIVHDPGSGCGIAEAALMDAGE